MLARSGRVQKRLALSNSAKYLELVSEYLDEVAAAEAAGAPAGREAVAFLGKLEERADAQQALAAALNEDEPEALRQAIARSEGVGLDVGSAKQTLERVTARAAAKAKAEESLAAAVAAQHPNLAEKIRAAEKSALSLAQGPSMPNMKSKG